MCNIFKLLLSLGQYNAWDQFLRFSGYFKSLTDVNGYFKFLADVCGYFRSLVDIIEYLILVEFSGIIRLVEFNKFLKCRVDISGNFRLMNLSGFPKFQFRVRAVFYKAFLLAIGGSK